MRLLLSPRAVDRRLRKGFTELDIHSAEELSARCRLRLRAGPGLNEVVETEGVAWPRTVDELLEAQRALARAEPPPWRGPAKVIGGCAIRFPRGETGPGAAGDRAWAAAVAGSAQSVVAGEAGGRYEPGLLALREGPLLEAAVRGLAAPPDVLLVDATGRDHSRRAGLALHLGAVLDLPTVGVTHRPLLAAGDWPEDVGGASTPLMLDGETVGAWLRTRGGTRPVAVHAAWRTDVATAAAVVLAALGRHRTPEPLRRARRLARLARGSACAP